MPAIATLAPASLLVGIAMLWVFRRTGNQEAIRKVKARLWAHLYELRLFTDEPVLVWKAQCGLLAANARYLGLMLLPAAVMAVPMVLLLAQMECYYGRAPLAPGEEAIVTVQMKNAAAGPAPVLRAPEGIVVESPAVRVPGQGQISWRIRALRASSGNLEVVFPQGTAAKSVVAGAGPRYLSERRVSSLAGWLWHPGEERLRLAGVDSIEVRYRAASVHALGLDFDWLIWLAIISMASALIFKRRFGVAF